MNGFVIVTEMDFRGKAPRLEQPGAPRFSFQGDIEDIVFLPSHDEIGSARVRFRIIVNFYMRPGQAQAGRELEIVTERNVPTQLRRLQKLVAVEFRSGLTSKSPN